MTKRPLNERFTDKVLAGIKTTTIRDSPWPVWKDIMLYNWSGLPYRSKQVDVAPVIVESENEIIISNVDGIVGFLPSNVDGVPLYVTEGFDSHRELQDWFEKLVKPGQTAIKYLMRFRLLERSEA